MTEQEFDKFKLEAILRAYYFSMYAELETRIREIFKAEIITIDHKSRNKLYYYYGFLHASTEYIEYDKNSTVKTEKSYSENELFNDFSVIKIINIDKRDKIIPKFNFQVESLNHRTVNYILHDVIKKLIDMRNVLAHEPSNFEFKDKHVVELLSTQLIDQYNDFYFGDVSINAMDSKNKQVLSNLIYMKTIIGNLQTA